MDWSYLTPTNNQFSDGTAPHAPSTSSLASSHSYPTTPVANRSAPSLTLSGSGSVPSVSTSTAANPASVPLSPSPSPSPPPVAARERSILYQSRAHALITETIVSNPLFDCKTNPSLRNPYVFLGGSVDNTTWRREIAVPLLERSRVPYYNPQGKYGTMNSAANNRAKDTCSVLLFVIDSQTRAIPSMLEATEQIFRKRDVVIVIDDHHMDNVINTSDSMGASNDDVKRAHAFLCDAAARHSDRCDVYGSVQQALNSITRSYQNKQRIASAEATLASAKASSISSLRFTITGYATLFFLSLMALRQWIASSFVSSLLLMVVFYICHRCVQYLQSKQYQSTLVATATASTTAGDQDTGDLATTAATTPTVPATPTAALSPPAAMALATATSSIINNTPSTAAAPSPDAR